MKHYDVIPSCNNPGKGSENGSVEKSHDLLKKAIDQQLMLRGSRNFESQEVYEAFVQHIIEGRNRARHQRVLEGLALLKDLPEYAFQVQARLPSGGCVYSVPCRLVNYQLKACVYPSIIELYYGRHKVQEMMRASSWEKQVIDYRHIIHSLVRKPGAFEHYQYKESLFPGLIFRRAYDHYKRLYPKRGHKIYLQLLQLAALHGEGIVKDALNKDLDIDAVKEKINTKAPGKVPAVRIQMPSLREYNVLLQQQGGLT